MSHHFDKQAAGRLTLRECFDQLYDKTEITARTIAEYGFVLKRWEELTDDPAVKEVDEETLDAFRQKLLDAKYAPATVNGCRTMLRAILRRMGPRETRNPRGLSVIDEVPWMRPCRVVRGQPRRVSQDDLSRWYLGTRVMTRPRFAGPAPSFWQALIVVAFFTGLRKSDLFNLRFEDIDLECGEFNFQARKTQKAATFPLHPIAVEHIRRIRTGRTHVFRCHLATGGDLSAHFRAIAEAGGVKEGFTLHDLRRSGASEIERVRSGMARVFLQHAATDVTNVSYLNMTEELRECVEKMRVPLAFSGGIKLAERQLRKAQDEAATLMRSARLSPPVVPLPDESRFSSGVFEVRGRIGELKGIPLRVLQAIALAGRPLPFDEIVQAIWQGKGAPSTADLLRRRVHGVISYVRQVLRNTLYLPPSYDPVPCVQRDGRGGSFATYLPTVKGDAA
jgi:integrase